MVVVNSVMKQSHFVDTVTTITTIGSAMLSTYGNIMAYPERCYQIKVHNLWQNFMRELYHLLRIKLAATHYLQGNGQTEQVNQKSEQYLCVFINQQHDDWDKLLLFTEFQYNNHILIPPYIVTTYEQKGRLTTCTRVQYWAGLSIIVWQSSSSKIKFKQCSVQGLLECLLLGIV